MANSATVGALRVLLSADTAQFEKALAGADASTKKLANTMKRDLEPSQARINSLIRQFEGTQAKGAAEAYAQAIQKVGGVTKLTAESQERANTAIQKALSHYKALGQQAPDSLLSLQAALKRVESPIQSLGTNIESIGMKFRAMAGLFGVTLGAAAFTSFIKGAVDAAGNIVDLSAKTGLSIKAVQLYGAVAKQTGGDLDTYANAIFKLGINLAESGKEGEKTRNVLSGLGLSLATLKSQKPEDQFEAIAEKLKAITNDGERNRIGVLLFGKTWKDVAAGVVQGIGDIKNATDIASDAQVRAVDAASDAFDRFLENSKNKTIAFLGGVVLAVEAAQKRLDRGGSTSFGPDVNFRPKVIPAGMGGAGFNWMLNWFQGQEDARNPDKGKDINLPVDAPKQLDELTEAQKRYNEEIKKAADILTGKALAEQVKKLADEVKRAGGESKITAPQIAKLREELQDLWMAGAKIPPMLDKIRLSGFVDFTGDTKIVKEFREFTDELERLKKVGSQSPFVDFLPEHLMPDWMREIQKMRDNPMKPEDNFVKFIPKEFSNPAFLNGLFAAFAPPAQKAVGKGFKAGMSDAMQDLPKTILRAFQGGGDVFKSIGAMFGAAIGEAVADSLSKALKDSKVGKMLEDLLPGLGALGGGLIGKGLSLLNDKLFGGEARRVNDMRDAFIEANGGAQDMLHTIASLGNDPRLVAAWERINSAGSDKAFKSATDAYKKRLTEIQTALGQTASKLDSLASASQQFGGVLPKSLHGAAQQLLGMTGLTADLRKQLEKLIGQPSWQVLEERASALGIDKGALGAGFNQAKTKDLALGFVRDIQMFADAGADADSVLRGMSDELSTLLVEAQKTGAALPKTLEPYLKRLSEMGLLLDENGNAIDMGALSFADFEDEALEAMKDLLTEIKEILAKAFPAAADAAAKAIGRIGDAFKWGQPQQPTEGGSARLPGMWVPPDLSSTGSLSPDIAADYDGSVGLSAQQQTSTFIFNFDERALARSTVSYIPGETKRLGLNRV